MGGFDLHYQYPATGTVVSVPAYFIFRHKGIVSDRWDDGAPLVISNSFRRGGVVEELWHEFTQGQQFQIDDYPNILSPIEVVARARSKIGERYNPLAFNCEHFTKFCHGLAMESGQLAVCLIAGIAVAVLAASNKR